MTPRAAHTAVYMEDEDALYVFGGYDLNNVISTLQVMSFNKYIDFKYNIKYNINRILALKIILINDQ